MTRIVIVGEIYNADLSIGGGPVHPGGPGAPVDPGWGQRPPTDPGYGRPGWSPVDPGWGVGRPPHVGGGPVQPPHYPTGQPIPGGERPDNTLPEVLPQGGTEIPGDVYQPAPVPEEIASQYVVSVYDPKTTLWTTKTYPPR